MSFNGQDQQCIKEMDWHHGEIRFLRTVMHSAMSEIAPIWYSQHGQFSRATVSFMVTHLACEMAMYESNVTELQMITMFPILIQRYRNMN